jgi:hypothetical protein
MDRIHGVARGELSADVTCEPIPEVVVEQVKPESVSHHPFAALVAMHSGVAFRAQRDQVFDGVGSRMAAELSVMHLKIRHCATGLTPPAVAAQDLLAQTFVRKGIKTQPLPATIDSEATGFWANHAHDAFSRRFSRKACCCASGKNL